MKMTLTKIAIDTYLISSRGKSTIFETKDRLAAFMWGYVWALQIPEYA